MDENKRYEHDTLFILLKEIQQIQRVGDLSAQHMLSIRSLGDIIHPTFYVTKALLCPRNRTKSTFYSVYNINENTMKKMYTEIANSYVDGSTAMVENMGCEFLRDMQKKKKISETIIKEGYIRNIRDHGKNIVRFSDTFVEEQVIYKVEGKKRMKYHWNVQTNEVEAVLFKHSCSFIFGDNTMWDATFDLSDEENVIIVTNKKQIGKVPRERKTSKKKLLTNKFSKKRSQWMERLKGTNKELSLTHEIKLPNFFALKGDESDSEESDVKMISEKKNVLVSELKRGMLPVQHLQKHNN